MYRRPRPPLKLIADRSKTRRSGEEEGEPEEQDRVPPSIYVVKFLNLYLTHTAMLLQYQTTEFKYFEYFAATRDDSKTIRIVVDPCRSHQTKDCNIQDI